MATPDNGHDRSTITGESGFTLLEVMVVVVIMGIAAALGVPSYVQWNAKYQSRQAVSELQSNLVLARMAAMNQNTTVTVTPTVAGAGVALTATFINAAGGVALPQLGPKILGSGTTMVGGAVVFNSLGLRVGGPAGAVQTIVFTNPYGYSYSIGINPAGKSRWCPNNTGMCQ